MRMKSFKGLMIAVETGWAAGGETVCMDLREWETFCNFGALM